MVLPHCCNKFYIVYILCIYNRLAEIDHDDNGNGDYVDYFFY